MAWKRVPKRIRLDDLFAVDDNTQFAESSANDLRFNVRLPVQLGCHTGSYDLFDRSQGAVSDFYLFHVFLFQSAGINGEWSSTNTLSEVAVSAARIIRCTYSPPRHIIQLPARRIMFSSGLQGSGDQAHAGISGEVIKIINSQFGPFDDEGVSGKRMHRDQSAG